MNLADININDLKMALRHCTDGKHDDCIGCPYYKTTEGCKARIHSLIVIEMMEKQIDRMIKLDD